MRYKFVTDSEKYGPGRCRLVNAETGEIIPGVLRASIDISPENDYVPMATIVVDAELDIEAGGTVVEEQHR